MDGPGQASPKNSSPQALVSSDDWEYHQQQQDDIPGRPYQVFRNNTTEVEVIVKDVSKRSKKHVECKNETSIQDLEIIKLKVEVQNLRNNLSAVHTREVHNKTVYETIINELKKQLDLTNQREPDYYARIAVLELENEKMKVMLDLKTKMIRRIKNQLVCVKKILQFVVKSMKCSSANLDGLCVNSDVDYEEFEKELKKNVHFKFTANATNSTCAAINSSLLVDTKLNSLEKSV